MQSQLAVDAAASSEEEKAEVVCEGIVVHFVPIAFEECAHKKQERRLRLVEVGYEHLHYLVVKAWRNDDLRAGMKSRQAVAVQVGKQILQCSFYGYGSAIHDDEPIGVVFLLVRFPLANVQFVFRSLRIALQFHAHIVKTFERAHAGCAHGDGRTAVRKQVFEGMAMHYHVFGVHVVPFYLGALYGLEGACADV